MKEENLNINKNVILLKKLTDEPDNLTEEEKEYISNTDYDYLLSKAVTSYYSQFFTEEQVKKMKSKLINEANENIAFMVISRNVREFNEEDFNNFLNRLCLSENIKVLKKYKEFLCLSKQITDEKQEQIDNRIKELKEKEEENNKALLKEIDDQLSKMKL